MIKVSHNFIPIFTKSFWRREYSFGWWRNAECKIAHQVWPGLYIVMTCFIVNHELWGSRGGVLLTTVSSVPSTSLAEELGTESQWPRPLTRRVFPDVVFSPSSPSLLTPAAFQSHREAKRASVWELLLQDFLHPGWRGELPSAPSASPAWGPLFPGARPCPWGLFSGQTDWFPAADPGPHPVCWCHHRKGGLDHKEHH